MPLRTRELKTRVVRRTRAARDTGPTTDVRAQVAMRADFRCEVCGRPVGGAAVRSWHHRRPRAAGGTRRTDTNSPANLLLVCGTGTTGCHGRIETNRAWARSRGYLVTQTADPSVVPVQLPSGHLVRLTHDGTYQEAA